MTATAARYQIVTQPFEITLKRSGDVVLVRVRLMRFASLTCEQDFFYTPQWERETFSKIADVPKNLAAMVAQFSDDYNSINRR